MKSQLIFINTRIDGFTTNIVNNIKLKINEKIVNDFLFYHIQLKETLTMTLKFIKKTISMQIL